MVDAAGSTSPASEALLKGRGNSRVYSWRSVSLRTAWVRDGPRGGVTAARRRGANLRWQSHMGVEMYEAYNRSLGPVSPRSPPLRSRAQIVTVPSETTLTRHEWKLCSELGNVRLAPRIGGKNSKGLLGSLRLWSQAHYGRRPWSQNGLHPLQLNSGGVKKESYGRSSTTGSQIIHS